MFHLSSLRMKEPTSHISASGLEEGDEGEGIQCSLQERLMNVWNNHFASSLNIQWKKGEIK